MNDSKKQQIEQVPVFRKTIGGTTFLARIHCAEDGAKTLPEILYRIIETEKS